MSDIATIAADFNPLPTSKIAEAPEWLLALFAEKAARKAAPRTTSDYDGPADQDRDMQEARRRIEADLAEHGSPVDGAGSDHRAYSIAAWLGDLPLSDDTIHDLLHELWAPHFDRDWLAGKVANANAYRVNDPGVDHLPSASEIRLQWEVEHPEATEHLHASMAANPPALAPGAEVIEDDRIIAKFMTIGTGDERLDLADEVDEQDELFSDPPRDSTPYLAEGRIEAGSTVLLSGPAGVGKSMVAQQAIIALAHGREMFDPLRRTDRFRAVANGPNGWRPIEVGGANAGKPLAWAAPPAGLRVEHIEYLNYENKPEQMRIRARQIAKGMKLENRSPVTMRRRNLRRTRSPVLQVVNGALALTPFGIDWLRHMEAVADRLKPANGHIVGVLDSLTNAVRLPGKAKVDDDLIAQLVVIFDHWCAVLNMTLIVLFHPSYAAAGRGGSDIGHSQEFMNKPRQVLGLKKGQKDGVLELSVIMWNDGPHWSVTLGQKDGLWIAGATPDGAAGELDAVEQAYLERVYGAADLDMLRGTALSTEEIAAIEARHEQRLRADKSKTGKFGAGREAGKLANYNPMVIAVARRVAGGQYTADQFATACRMLRDQGRLAYYERASTRDDRPVGYCYPYTELVEMHRQQQTAEFQAVLSKNSASFGTA